MQRCLDLAAQGIGNVAPNPPVGAVIVYQNRIIGEGYHQQYGQAHAEPNAINSVLPQDKHLLSQSTLYVSLEPCSHFGKTPPCSDLIIKTGIPKVVIASPDPFELVNGQGIEKLRAAGIEVTIDILQTEANWLMRRFLTYHQQQRPYIILKWAQTANHFIAPTNKQQQWISNSFAKMLTHRWRTEEQAILVGTNTALADNPQLTARLWIGKQPLRLVIDRYGRLQNKPLHLLDNSLPTVVFTQTHPNQNVNQANLQYIPINFEHQPLQQILHFLYQQKIQSVIVEGGAALLNSFIDANLWDEARVFTAPIYWDNGLTAPLLSNAKLHQKQKIDDNCLTIFTNLQK
ncbi:MAG: bifunctional diaminohydroxyphosphoribosylaminopyrimidine deaminase/5-amino-6-(5-phosphoribosylamino)uracil reductase RibD [Sphingobacteriales bacterium]|nr:bifunctional diaminohydroxyphosphoribosylaminopyrimidine deaminase/5-amino-6-(5-phosphoribosylamino)uracil reductase RibD [Sphingobacteriales bacterium]